MERKHFFLVQDLLILLIRLKINLFTMLKYLIPHLVFLKKLIHVLILSINNIALTVRLCLETFLK